MAPYNFLKSEKMPNFNLKNCHSIFQKTMKLKICMY